ncbi:response regulator [Cohnella nanjingensis]|uniref:Response regulator n=1 Tax=Cohnella nanjingensis TaxID=1387779 RepID=A0A7X0VH47_9BACL|nr:response regulator [Cohnella nanjingensis]MBB6673103.1 response regulator [Cohnella nanjingensis]
MYTFIIVDDEALIRRGMLKKIRATEIGSELAFAGEADNGEDGLALIRSADPDIVITDMRMPEMDGKSFLKLLQADFPDKKIIVVSGYSDFEYMREAISAKAVGYLLKPFSRDEIQETLRKAVGLLETERSARAQMARSESEKEALSYAADLQTLCHLILGIQRADQAPVMRSSRLRSLPDAARYALLTLTAPDRLPAEPAGTDPADALYVPHAHHDRMGFLLLLLPLPDRMRGDEEAAYAERTAHLVLGHLPAGSAIGISGAKTDWRRLEEAYRETVAALDARPAAGDAPAVARYAGGRPAADAVAWEPMDELVFFLESGNVPRVAEWIGKLFDDLREMSGLTLAEVKETCRILVHEARELLQRTLAVAGGPPASSSFEVVLRTSFDSESLRVYLLQLLPDIAAMLRERSAYASDQLVDNIRTYVERHYDRTLTLEKIASLFFLNPSYVSYLFKEKTGVNFIDYVNKVRMDRAKILLRTTDDKVYKIAKALGYDNPKYFFRVFKKVAGYTPEEYRLLAADDDKRA